MGHIFISHAEEQAAVAEELAELLNEAGFSTWRYQHENRFGNNFLLKIARAVEECEAFILLISRDAFGSPYVNREVARALDCQKPLIPLLYRIKLEEVKAEKSDWSLAISTTIALPIPKNDISRVVPDVIGSLKELGVADKPSVVTPQPWWKSLGRSVARRPARVKYAAALCALVVLALVSRAFWPSVVVGKAGGLLDVNFRDNKFDYSFDLEITNYDFWPQLIGDLDATIETDTLPATDAKKSYYVCHHDGREVEFPHEARSFANTMKWRCTVTIVTDDAQSGALQSPDVTQRLMVTLLGTNDAPYPRPLKFCFKASDRWPVTTRGHDDCL